ncbi:hypothetical protein WJX81_006245 [Elliptochloris bilobata]|uniref:Uncharacterized protein n=1 Tax=Elliptochloris bilobata TaxID=381761 RepID=A0AAW1S0K1_9CHLO
MWPLSGLTNYTPDPSDGRFKDRRSTGPPAECRVPRGPDADVDTDAWSCARCTPASGFNLNKMKKTSAGRMQGPAKAQRQRLILRVRFPPQRSV